MGPEAPPEVTSRAILGVNTFQMPNQLASFLLRLGEYRIRNYFEVGSFLGGTFYIVDSYLRLTQPEYEGGTAIDILNRMQDFEAYCTVHPETRFIEMRSVDFDPGRGPPTEKGTVPYCSEASAKGGSPRRWVYYLVFLDSDHSYEYLSQEFAHFVPHARLIALHDIVSTHPYCPGTRRFWNEIKDQFENRLRRGGQAHFAHRASQNERVPGGSYHEFVEQYPGRSNVMGIGLIETELAEFAEATNDTNRTKGIRDIRQIRGSACRPGEMTASYQVGSSQANRNAHAAAIDEILASYFIQRLPSV